MEDFEAKGCYLFRNALIQLFLFQDTVFPSQTKALTIAANALEQPYLFILFYFSAVQWEKRRKL